MADSSRAPTLRAVRRDGERVTPLELFFDLVFVLAITQCTTLMADHPSWTGVGQALLLLALLWWAWVGYAWLTSVLDPEEGAVRLAFFGATAAFVVAALAIPEAFTEEALTLAIAYGVVRAAHIALFLLASRDEPALRHSVVGLGASTGIGVALLVAGALAPVGWRGGLWALALVLDMAGPFFFGAEGWQLVPGHFAERHGLIVIIALGESVVAIGVGVGLALSAELIVGAVLGVLLAGGLWWVYFDVTSIIAARRLASLPPGREQNEMARDAYSYIHFPMVAGIVLSALALKTVLAHIHHPLEPVPATALGGGLALYLLAHVLFKWRTVGTWRLPRAVAALVLVALIPLLQEVEPLGALGIVTAVIALLVGFESVRYAAVRAEERSHLHEPAPE